MTDRLTPEREAEIAARATSEHLTPGPWTLDRESCDCGGDYPCGHGMYVTGVIAPTPTEIAAERCKQTGEQPRDYDFHRSEMCEFSDADWELMAHARTDVPALLAELAAVRAERNQARAELAEYEPLNPQQCPAGKHADWLVDSEYTHACPWCRIESLKTRVHELERPAIEAKRNEIRQSYAELIATCHETKDYEGAFDVECRLREREEQWKREDEETVR